ncbi:CBU_0592 family membrane protein [Streptomyces luteolus]|uniref:CBU-0592-like domain-containing protein n=1 Tax=Streptomyces luteolus TaxID=3043615 RepID=A0ABT6ST77_9ACTN|nr:hypothetical protein [Streptomyces sp. B-S-A12]MDI3418546.1 hypothetical protein [Streptomyces sp. B-S-A12]
MLFFEYVQIAAALMMITTFALLSTGTIHPRKSVYPVLLLTESSVMLAGSLVLGKQTGIILLETAWIVIAAASLARRQLELAKVRSGRATDSTTTTCACAQVAH